MAITAGSELTAADRIRAMGVETTWCSILLGCFSSSQGRLRAEEAGEKPRCHRSWLLTAMRVRQASEVAGADRNVDVRVEATRHIMQLGRV